MKTTTNLLVAAMLLATASGTLAAVRYVNLNSASPTPPYTNWATAATVIQDAVDVAAAGDEVVVTNGIYATGGWSAYGNLISRVAVTLPLTVRSVNGPQFTVIQGHQVAGITNGDGAARCVYLAVGASLSGFTLTNGSTGFDTHYYSGSDFDGGGVFCESTNAVVSDCVIAGNTANSAGGGAYGGTLSDCTLIGNSADQGGGASGGYDYPCVLNNCVLTSNSAVVGGGAGNYNGHYTLNNCALIGNSADEGGGAFGGTLNNCTLIGNAARRGGGASGEFNPFDGPNAWCYLNNCIVYFNTAPQEANYVTAPEGAAIGSKCTLNYCCTTPLPAEGVGNISADPQMATLPHLTAACPCREAGSTNYATGVDIDGQPWANPPSIGCDEYLPGAVIGPLSVGVSGVFPYVAAGYAVSLTAEVEGQTTVNVWDFGDGTKATNQPYASHAWSVPGDYALILRAYNDSQPGGIVATVAVHVVAQPVHYAAAESINPVCPYVSWATAARTIQQALDAAAPGALVLVTNGIYAGGGRAVYGWLSNRAAVDKPLAVRSVNGPQFTVIQGYQVPGTTNGYGAIRCVHLAEGASLSGFTLSRNDSD